MVWGPGAYCLNSELSYSTGPDYFQTPCVHALGMSSTSLPHSDAKAPLNKGGASSGNTCLPVSPASLPASLSEGVHPVLGVQDTRAVCRYLPTC